MDTLKVLDLFSGIGGFSLGLEWTGGFETIAFCDIDTYSQRLLQQNWKDVPVVSDIRLLSYKKGKLYYDGRLIYTGRIDVVTGGFPCQPFSTSGKRGGTNDDRYLWPEMLRIIEETKPTWVIGENVNGITSMGIELGTPSVESRSIARYSNQDFYDAIHARQEKMLVNKICEDVEQIGYEIQPLVIPACSLGAWHRRDRVWIIANSQGERIQGLGSCWEQILDAYDGQEVPVRDPEGSGQAHWQAEPDVGRVVHGFSGRVDRIKGLGNAVVPQIPYIIGYYILIIIKQKGEAQCQENQIGHLKK